MSSFASPDAPYLFHESTLAPLADVEPLGPEGEDFWFDGDGGKPVHGFVLRPKSRQRTLPLAFLIHGGPQGAWLDSWSWRWNASVFTAAGYLTVALNPTGSTGYGQAFTDAINCDWGGAPYRDLVRGYEALLARLPEIDRDRTAALGASYGGYMVNWLMGHNPGFAAFVCHDGPSLPEPLTSLSRQRRCLCAGQHILRDRGAVRQSRTHSNAVADELASYFREYYGVLIVWS